MPELSVEVVIVIVDVPPPGIIMGIDHAGKQGNHSPSIRSCRNKLYQRGCMLQAIKYSGGIIGKKVLIFPMVS